MMLLRSNKFIMAIAILLCTFYSCSSPNTLTVQSPNKQLTLKTFLTKNGELHYTVDKDGQAIIKPSKLGFKLKDIALDDNFSIINFNTLEFDETWEQIWGEKQFVRNHYRQLEVELQSNQNKAIILKVVFKVYDDGLGFRYEFPKQAHLHQFEIMDELTEFNLADNGKGWGVKAYQPDRYEYLYKQYKVSEMRDSVHTPFTIELDNQLAISIHEANLTDYASMTLYRSNNTKLTCDLVPWANGTKVYAQTPFHTPWRTISIAENAARLTESDLILNLNEPCQLANTDWIQPAKYIGIWWEMHLGKSSWGQGEKHGATTENTMKYMDFAAEHGFNGVLVEGWNHGWDSNWWQDGSNFNFTTPYPDFDIEAITNYGRTLGVGLIGHHETGAAIKNYESQLSDAMQFYKQHGVHYIKTGYVNPKGADTTEWHHGQYMVRHYRKVIEEAAKNQIMICAHEPIKPTGIRRTYPNMMSREGARGMEFNAWGPNGGNPPEHETILAFTRLLAGPMDFTPGIFELSLKDKEHNQVNTTLAKQLALYVVLYSPLQMAADLPENYINQPAFQFIKDVPVDWSQSICLNGKIGEYITFARKDRHSDNWFIGSITNKKARVIDINLSFLDKDARYIATIYADGEEADYQSNPTSITIDTRQLGSADKLQLSLAPGGGQAISLVKQK